MDAYCISKGVPSSRARYVIDGEDVLPSDCAEDLGLVSGDIIDSIDKEGLRNAHRWVLWT